tara:strand:+ start:429 stop:626 length:198 start_codon:yes stop_codon:yes gene_type:complete
LQRVRGGYGGVQEEHAVCVGSRRAEWVPELDFRECEIGAKEVESGEGDAREEECDEVDQHDVQDI